MNDRTTAVRFDMMDVVNEQTWLYGRRDLMKRTKTEERSHKSLLAQVVGVQEFSATTEGLDSHQKAFVKKFGTSRFMQESANVVGFNPVQFQMSERYFRLFAIATGLKVGRHDCNGYIIDYDRMMLQDRSALMHLARGARELEFRRMKLSDENIDILNESDEMTKHDLLTKPLSTDPEVLEMGASLREYTYSNITNNQDGVQLIYNRIF